MKIKSICISNRAPLLLNNYWYFCAIMWLIIELYFCLTVCMDISKKFNELIKNVSNRYIRIIIYILFVIVSIFLPYWIIYFIILRSTMDYKLTLDLYAFLQIDIDLGDPEVAKVANKLQSAFKFKRHAAKPAN